MKLERVFEALETALENAEMRLKWEQERTEQARQDLAVLKVEHDKLQLEHAKLQDNYRQLTQGLADV